MLKVLLLELGVSDADIRLLERALERSGRDVKVISRLAYESMILYLFNEAHRLERSLGWYYERGVGTPPPQSIRDKIEKKSVIVHKLLKKLGGCFRDHTSLLINERCSVCGDLCG